MNQDAERLRAYFVAPGNSRTQHASGYFCMKHWTDLVIATALVCLAGVCRGQNDPSLHTLTDRILVPKGIARITELTANIEVTNKSSTPIKQFIFRVTAPVPDLPHQRATTFLPPQAAWKTHKNQVDHYVELELAIPPSTSVHREVKSLLLLLPVDYERLAPNSVVPVSSSRSAVEPWSRPSRFVESDAPAITAIVREIFFDKKSDLDKARAAYEYPVKVIRYQPQPAIGALQALQSGSGDCTEFACLFAALCRAGGVPARTTSVFNLGNRKETVCSEPNHNAAEAFLPDWGWVPVDANLGGGKYTGPIGFAKTGNSVITLAREGAWVWSNWLPPDGFDKGKPAPIWSAGLSWKIRVIEEGDSRQLLARFQSPKPNGD